MKRREFFRKTGVVSVVVGAFCASTVLSLLIATTKVRADDETKFRWTVAKESALARDDSSITIEGVGTFVPEDPEEVTGGGNWTARDANGMITGGGTFEVTRLLKFDLEPQGRFLPGPATRAGLAFLSIKYSDGGTGVLVTSCSLRCAACNPNSPASQAEGFSASKGFTMYWKGFKNIMFFTLLSEEKE